MRFVAAAAGCGLCEVEVGTLGALRPREPAGFVDELGSGPYSLNCEQSWTDSGPSNASH